MSLLQCSSDQPFRSAFSSFKALFWTLSSVLRHCDRLVPGFWAGSWCRTLAIALDTGRSKTSADWKALAVSTLQTHGCIVWSACLVSVCILSLSLRVLASERRLLSDRVDRSYLASNPIGQLLAIRISSWSALTAEFQANMEDQQCLTWSSFEPILCVLLYVSKFWRYLSNIA